MRKLAFDWWEGLRTTGGRAVLIGAALCGAMSLAGVTTVGQEKDKSGVNVTVTGKDGSEAGLIFSAQATAKEAGLPLYPGARPHKDEKDDSSGAKMGRGGSHLGLNLGPLRWWGADCR